MCSTTFDLECISSEVSIRVAFDETTLLFSTLLLRASKIIKSRFLTQLLYFASKPQALLLRQGNNLLSSLGESISMIFSTDGSSLVCKDEGFIVLKDLYRHS